jgi:hypothetical protein
LPASTYIVEHVTICTRCRDIDVDAISDHHALIKEQNDHIAKLDAKIVEYELENEKKLNLLVVCFYNGRFSCIKDGVSLQTGNQVNTKCPWKQDFQIVKGKAPMG